MRLERAGSLVLVGLLFSASGCQFYFGDDDDDDQPCERPEAPGAPYEILNPYTLACESPWGGGGCVSPAGAPAEDGFRDSIAYDWAECTAACASYGESDCLAADGCRAIYTELEVFEPNAIIQRFTTCVATAPSGPVRGGSCEVLDAQECSRHDDCSAVHASVPGDFERCQSEPVCAAGDSLPMPQQRDPESGQCVGGGGPPCSNDGFDPAPPGPGQDWGSCESECTDLSEGDCRASDACRAIYANACRPNEDCYALEYAACWPTAPSGPVRGGSCQNLDAYTCSLHDDCTAIHANDWSACGSDDCTPTLSRFERCDDESAPPLVCYLLPESACIERDDCTPLYEGIDCSCTPMGCGCNDWSFTACEANP
jgi:hypothetical protein